MTTRRLALWILCLTLMGAGGCEKPANILSRLLVQPETAAELGYGIQWVTNLSLPRGENIIYAELLGDRLVTFETGSIISVLDAGTGAILWRAQAGKRIERFSKPVRYENQLAICSETRAYVYDINHGDLLKIFPLAYVSNATPVIVGGLLIHGSPTGVVFAQDLSQGLLRWSFQIGSAIGASPIMAGPTLVVASNLGQVYGFNPYTGVVIWRTSTFDKIISEPAGNELLVYVASTDQSLYAYERTSGQQRWRYYSQDILARGPTIVGDYVFQWVPSEKYLCLDAVTGEKLWSHDYPHAKPLMMRNDMLYLSRPGKLTLLDPRRGDELKVVDLPAVDHVIASSKKDGDLYLIRLSGPIMKLTPR
jgi:outer membrane protein assembly factor BamB